MVCVVWFMVYVFGVWVSGFGVRLSVLFMDVVRFMLYGVWCMSMLVLRVVCRCCDVWCWCVFCLLVVCCVVAFCCCGL